MDLLISGVLGKMGKAVCESAFSRSDIKIVAGVDANAAASSLSFPVYADFGSVSEKADCIIDFSSPAALDGLLRYAAENKIPAVLCTTGYDEAQIAKINAHAKRCAIFRSANMSLGVNVMIELCKKAARLLEGFDAEIIEKHHNRKKDAPSGTALMIADGIREVRRDAYCVNGREGNVGARKPDEIGVHAVRGGTIVGEHEVIFAGTDEVVTIKHQAENRSVFAQGAIKAALFVSSKKRGMYNMQDLMENA